MPATSCRSAASSRTRGLRRAGRGARAQRHPRQALRREGEGRRLHGPPLSPTRCTDVVAETVQLGQWATPSTGSGVQSARHRESRWSPLLPHRRIGRERCVAHQCGPRRDRPHRARGLARRRRRRAVRERHHRAERRRRSLHRSRLGGRRDGGTLQPGLPGPPDRAPRRLRQASAAACAATIRRPTSPVSTRRRRTPPGSPVSRPALPRPDWIPPTAEPSATSSKARAGRSPLPRT